MFKFIKQTFIVLSNISGSLAPDSIKCISTTARTALADTISNKPHCYPFTVSVYKCGGSCNTVVEIGNPQVPICVLSKVKDMNVKVSNLISGIIETKFLV